MASVEHPNVVRIYSFGEAAGRAYIEMEMVEGESLATRIRRHGRISVNETAEIALAVTRALEAAWSQGPPTRSGPIGACHVSRIGTAASRARPSPAPVPRSCQIEEKVRSLLGTVPRRERLVRRAIGPEQEAHGAQAVPQPGRPAALVDSPSRQ